MTKISIYYGGHIYRYISRADTEYRFGVVLTGSTDITGMQLNINNGSSNYKIGVVTSSGVTFTDNSTSQQQTIYIYRS